MNSSNDALARWVGRGFLFTMMAVAMAGCGGESEQNAANTPSATGAPSANDSSANDTSANDSSASDSSSNDNDAPKVSGTPGRAANAGMAYSFQPSATDPDGDALTFSVQNLPSWASFNASNGRLSGTPSAAHVGRYSNIRISASDGKASASLAAFSIEVAQSSDGRVTLSWNPPEQNTDGSALTDLAGYRILYGTDPKSLSQSLKVDNPSVSTYIVDNLFTATWYFTVKAYTRSGRESSDSGLASTVIL